MTEIQNKWSELAIVSFTCAILSYLIPLLFFELLLKPKVIEWAPALGIAMNTISMVLWTLAIIPGLRAMRQIKSNPALKGRVMAISGIVLGVLGVVLALCSIVVWLAVER